MKVGILTTLYEANTSYSLWTVMESQLVSLVKNGYDTVLFVHDNFNDDAKVPAGVEIRKIVPRFILVDYSTFKEPSEDLDKQAKKVYEVLKKEAADIDVMIEHDMLLQGWFLQYGMAIHKLAEDMPIKWLHWVHSVPKDMPADTKYPHTVRFNIPKNSKLVYLNNFSLQAAAEAYHAFPKDVKIVYNPVDPRLFWHLDPFVKNLVDKYALLEKDFIQVYPLSTPRMIDRENLPTMKGGKQIHLVIEIMAALKGLGKKVAIIVANAHANDRREKELISEVLAFAAGKGLNQAELIFTSLEDTPRYEAGVSRGIVSQLFRLSNLFIFPSVSENCPLILMEAMLSNCLLVLNENVGSMREFGKDNALYFKFGSLSEDITYHNREQFMVDVAKIIVSEFENNKVLKGANYVKQQLNYDVIFERQILPLLHEYGNL